MLKRWQERLHLIYLGIAVISIIVTANLTPAFQVPDELNHFIRAEQVSRGVLVARFMPESNPLVHRTSPDKRIIYPDSGAYIGNLGIYELALPYDSIKFHPELKLSKSQIEKSANYYWSAAVGPLPFPNTAIYPPTGYLFSAMGILAGKWMNLSILKTLILSRILNGIACALICFYALSLAGRIRLLLFFILLLPLTISLFASVSQDGLLISLSVLMAGIITRVESDKKKTYSSMQLVILILGITVIAAARPPYIFFIAVFFFLRLPLNRTIFLFVVPFVLIGIWTWLNRRNYAVVFAPVDMQVNAKLQWHFILNRPFHFLILLFHFITEEFSNKIREFIGVLGWLNLFLPEIYYKIAYVIFLVTGISVFNYSRTRIRLRTVFFISGVVTFVAVMATQYITWMPLESPVLGGVQSRYFIPPFIFLATGMAGFQKDEHIARWQRPLSAAVILFSVISQIVLAENIITRFY